MEIIDILTEDMFVKKHGGFEYMAPAQRLKTNDYRIITNVVVQ